MSQDRGRSAPRCGSLLAIKWDQVAVNGRQRQCVLRLEGTSGCRVPQECLLQRFGTMKKILGEGAKDLPRVRRSMSPQGGQSRLPRGGRQS